MSLSGITKKTKKFQKEKETIKSLETLQTILDSSDSLSSFVTQEQLIQTPSIPLIWKDKKETPAGRLSFAIKYCISDFLRKVLTENPELLEEDVLFEACLLGKEDHVRMLVNEFHMDVNKKAKYNYNSYPLIGAIGNGHASIVEFLLDNGARIDVERDLVIFKETPIQCCQRELKGNNDGKLNAKYIEIFKMLVKKGADLATPHQYLKESPLEYIEALKKNPEHCQALAAIFSQPEPSVNEIAEVMGSLHLNFDREKNDVSALVYAVTSFSILNEGLTINNAPQASP